MDTDEKNLMGTEDSAEKNTILKYSRKFFIIKESFLFPILSIVFKAKC